MKKMLLIDGNSLIHRAFHALPPLRTSKGVYTNAVYGFTNMFLRVLKEEEPDYIMVAFDKKGPTFRHKEYSLYKATRSKTPDELIGQFDIVKQILDALYIAYMEVEGFEADDILGTISKMAEESDIFSLIITGDKDALQLVSPKTNVMLTKKGISEMETYDPRRIKERYGVSPEAIADLKGLMGDKSDNIPGVPGVGEKTAMKLLKEFGSVEKVLDSTDKLKGKLKENIENHREQAKISKHLATIVRNIDLNVDFEDFARREPDYENLTELFMEMEFYSLIDRIDRPTGKGEPQVKFTLICVNSQEDLDLLIKNSSSLECLSIAIDGEKEDIRGLGICHEDKIFYLPYELLNLDEEVRTLIRPLLEREEILKITSDAKHVRNILKQWDIDFYSQFDISLAAYLLDPSRPRYDIDTLAFEYLGIDLGNQDGEIEKIGYFYRLKEVIDERLKDYDMESLFYDVEMPLCSILADMENFGVKVDSDKLQDLSKKFGGKLLKLTEDIYELSDTEFNINSPKQLGEVLFEKLGLPVIKKTKTGYSTDAEVLEKLRPNHPIIEKILEYRFLMKMKSTYADGLLALVNKNTGKIHTSFNQTVTTTGRISSTEPNLQNIPVKTEEGKHIRGVFTAEGPGHVLLSGDYSQIELRVLAHISEDPGLIEAFTLNTDIHTRTASEVFGVSPEDVTPLLRDRAKAVNFGIVYGISDYGLAQGLGISNKEAQDYINAYFDRYPRVKDYIRDTIKKAKQNGYVTTLLNRRRYIPDITSRNYNIRSFAERTAMNTPIQGSAADIIKVAMVKVYNQLKLNNLKTKLLLQVHDELIFDVPVEELSIVKKIVKENMENALSLKVPLIVDFTEGYTWEEL